jgi:PAS domain S-box-containing protein
MSSAIPQTNLPLNDANIRTLLDSAPDAILIVNQERRIVLVNSQTEKLFGYRRDELLQQPVEILVPERLAENHREYTAGFIAAPKQQPMVRNSPSK